MPVHHAPLLPLPDPTTNSPFQLLLLTGYPSSGKTHRAHQLLAYLRSRIASASSTLTSRLQVIHINDQTLNIPRSAYREAKTEKEARAAFYSAVKRALGRDTIVVGDGLNYIKGFRYQLYCEAKGVRTTNCVVSPLKLPLRSVG